jgi:hypothetical protein
VNKADKQKLRYSRDMTRERIRQIEMAAAEQLCDCSEAKRLQEYVRDNAEARERGSTAKVQLY